MGEKYLAAKTISYTNNGYSNPKKYHDNPAELTVVNYDHISGATEEYLKRATKNITI